MRRLTTHSVPAAPVDLASERWAFGVWVVRQEHMAGFARQGVHSVLCKATTAAAAIAVTSAAAIAVASETAVAALTSATAFAGRLSCGADEGALPPLQLVKR